MNRFKVFGGCDRISLACWALICMSKHLQHIIFLKVEFWCAIKYAHMQYVLLYIYIYVRIRTGTTNIIRTSMIGASMSEPHINGTNVREI